MRYPTLLFLLPLTLLFTPGCVHEAGTEAEFEPEPPLVAPVAAEYGEVDVATASPGDEQAARVDPTLPEPPRPSHDPVFFPLGAGYGALGRIDLSPCRDEGLPPGYWHLRATFRQSGRIVHASVQSPTAPSPEALRCISEELEASAVPRFDGDDVTLSKNFFVGAAADPAGGGVEDIEVQTPRRNPAAVAANAKPLDGASAAAAAR